MHSRPGPAHCLLLYTRIQSTLHRGGGFKKILTAAVQCCVFSGSFYYSSKLFFLA